MGDVTNSLESCSVLRRKATFSASTFSSSPSHWPYQLPNIFLFAACKKMWALHPPKYGSSSFIPDDNFYFHHPFFPASQLKAHFMLHPEHAGCLR